MRSKYLVGNAKVCSVKLKEIVRIMKKRVISFRVFGNRKKKERVRERERERLIERREREKKREIDRKSDTL